MSFRCFVEQKLGKFPSSVIHVILEWVMIISIFVDGFLSFASNQFAKLFELRIPCLLCSKIDHVFVNRNYYNDLICEEHKKDISSLAYCHVHKNLSDIRNMCVGCLLSFATEKDSDCDRYKSLMGILHKDIDYLVEDDQKNYAKSGKKDDREQFDKSVIEKCSCCGEPLKIKPSSKYSRSPSLNASSYSQAPTPSPRAPLLPHIRYTELKLVQDNDSELANDEVPIAGKEEIKAVTMPLLPDSEDFNDDSWRTPTFSRGNRFFGIPLSDSAQNSPKWRTTRKMALDKQDFVTEPTDPNTVSEGDGDTIVHNLKKQVRLDRKSLIELYMELDEERSASAIAANNAMAMITRLQAEKAAVQMEALQYQRMMEEQAEYDQEALQAMNELILKREEEIKEREEEIRDLESELDVYRIKYGELYKEGSEADGDENYQELKSRSFSSFSEKSELLSPNEAEQNGERDRAIVHSGVESSLDFEGEKSYLLNLLTNLERKINEPTSSESNTDKPGNEDKGNETKDTIKEITIIRERLRAVEAEAGFLKHAAMTLQKGEGTRLLTEIAQHLRKLRSTARVPLAQETPSSLANLW